jgi:outer membrane protein TolC
VREVRTAWLQANTAYQRFGVTAQLLAEAKLAFELAEARYRLGLSSIVELSQAQLQQTALRSTTRTRAINIVWRLRPSIMKRAPTHD